MRSFDRALENGRSIRVRWTVRDDGDFAVIADEVHSDAAAALDRRRRAIVDREWVWMQQVHGARCLDIDVIGVAAACGSEADAAVTTGVACALAIQTADCVPIGVWSEDGAIAVIHAGWRGFDAGVIDAALDELRCRSSAPLHAVIGPSIGPECYAFGERDLDRLCERFGEHLRARTSADRPALDVRRGVRRSLEQHDVVIELDDDACTSCDQRFFSHRARQESSRQTLVIWLEES